jgi:putative protease
MARKRPEVLAPAGDEASLRAAVRAGADAVYFGLQNFNARARATNFDEAALARTLAHLHEHGVKGYVALNTLCFDDELPALERAVRACADAGVDAVIVQDLGVARLVREVAPQLPMHASTQMTCTDVGAVEFARELGARRVVLARELSLEDIAAIRRGTDVELEVFVHGALCVAYSGQCLTSEAIGGRSANRGACAQACRLPYELVVDGDVRPLGDAAYLLSPQDLEASALVPRLSDLGVAALKIEGRLKGPEYVYATTRLYREAVDAAAGVAAKPGEGTRRAALQTFTRGSGPGFLEGVDHQRLVDGETCDHRGLEVGTSRGVAVIAGRRCVRVLAAEPIARGDGLLVQGGFAGEGEVGGRVWELWDARGRATREARAGEEVAIWLGPERALGAIPAGRRVFRTHDPRSEREVRARITREAYRTPLRVTLRGRIGEPLAAEATSLRDGRRAEVRAEHPLERARGAPTTAEAVRAQLERLGDTPFALAELVMEIEEGAFLPASALNRVRRELVAALGEQARRRHATTDRSAASLLAEAKVPDRAPPPPGLYVLCRTLAQAEAAVDAGAAGVVLDFLELTGTGDAVRALRQRGPVHVTLAPPRIRKPGEEKIDRYLERLAPDALLVRGLGALREGAAVPRIGDFSLNVTNRLAAAEVLSRGLAAFTPSFDLDAAQLEALLSAPGLAPFAEVVVHHPMPLFHMEHCVIAARLSEGRDHTTCGRPCERHAVSLRDRAGMEHPVEADVGCRNTVFHAKAQSAATLVPRLRELGVRRFRIELVREGAKDTSALVRTYGALVAGRMGGQEAWHALRVEAGYGVVRGTLRVVP